MNKRHSRSILPLVALCLLFSTPTLRSQTTTTPGSSLLPGSKPADVPLQWKQLVGIYKEESGDIIILERGQHLVWQAPNWYASMFQDRDGAFWISIMEGPRVDLLVQRNSSGDVVQVSFVGFDFTTPAYASRGNKRRDFPRTDAGSDPVHFYHVTPTKPLDQLRAAALTAKPPAEPGSFRKPDLAELTTLDPAFHLDIRYAQSNNFLSTPIYTQARAFLQRPAAEALLRVLHKLRPLGYGLLIHDAYRPWYVTKLFWDATPPEGRIFVADPKKGSRHNRGCAVDLTLYNLATGQPIEMPGLYDEMSPRSFPNFPGGTSLQRWHRDLLRRAMESEGFTVNEDEWWHFDFREWKQYPILNIPFENLRLSQPRP